MSDLVDELRSMLREELSRRRALATDVARLKAEAAETSFRAVADGMSFESARQLRFDTARQLIAGTNISLAQISAMLDFSEPAAFTRAFHRWSGETPSGYRVEHKPALV
jgi:transcriptional regulator GlxA family with amidase domain